MSIASEISRLQTAKNTLKTKINAKNNTQNQITDETIDEYGDFVDSIPTGVTPTGTKQISITQNGTITEDVANYATAQITTNVVNQDYEDALVAFGVEEDLADNIEALTTYSNEVTGESDTTLSDAVRTLTDGYGGGSADIFTGTFVGKGTTEITISAPFDPDIVIAYSPNKLADFAVNATWYFFLGSMVSMSPRRTTSGWGDSTNVVNLPSSNNRPGKTYADGALTLYANGSSIYQFANGATYNYILVKLP